MEKRAGAYYPVKGVNFAKQGMYRSDVARVSARGFSSLKEAAPKLKLAESRCEEIAIAPQLNPAT